MVYQPTMVKGNKPVTIGHQYSSVILGLEPETGLSLYTVPLLLVERVSTVRQGEGGRQPD
ncbi:MAG: hypothetical protein U0401_10755 [Anaerolineae bacterium]